jgi:uncharacterized protein YjbJ (UPF0337 family)
MNWDQIEGNWKLLKGKFREKWGKLTDIDLEVVAGRRDHLLGKLQEKYGLKREQAEKKLDERLSRS